MPSLKTIFLCLVPLLSMTVEGAAAKKKQQLHVVWSAGHFETISGPIGNNIGHKSGFAITDSKGVELYSAKAPDDHAPCYNVGDGRTFTMKSTCWKETRKFNCKADFAGDPDKCKVLNKDNKLLSEAKGGQHFTFTGISISSDASCGTTFNLRIDESCSDKDKFEVV